MNQYILNKKKFFITLFCSIAIIVIGVLVSIIFISNTGRAIATSVFVAIGGGFYTYKIFCEYNAYVIISDKGIVYHRGKEDANLTWNDIKRLERSGLPFGALGEMMVIHTTRGKIYIDYNFANYLDAWKLVISIGKEKNPNLLIDHDLKKRVSDS